MLHRYYAAMKREINFYIFLYSVFISFNYKIVTCSPLFVEKLGENHMHKNDSYVTNIMRISKAAEMANLMNTSVDPCDDFYAFSCGNWAKINPANSVDHVETGFFETISSALDRKILLVLKESINEKDTLIDKQVKKFYKSCINTKNSLSEYKKKLIQIIDDFGEMPALKNGTWEHQNFDWLQTVAKISHEYGIKIIISLDLLADFKNNKINRLYFGHFDFPLQTKSLYLDASTAVYRLGYKKDIADKLNYFFGLNKETARVVAEEIVEFEVSLAHGLEDEKLGLGLEELSHLTTVDKMHSEYAPDINIQKYFNISLGGRLSNTVYEMVPDYQKNLIDVIKANPPSTVANFIFYNLLRDFLLKPEAKQLKQEKQCVQKTKNLFAQQLDNMIFRKYDLIKSENDVNLIWNELQKSFNSNLMSEDLVWISKATREYAIEKLNAMKLEINSYNLSNLTRDYENLVISETDYIQNIKNLLRIKNELFLEEILQPPKPLNGGAILSYSPANIFLENKVSVPVSMLQPFYLWALSYPQAVKFGTLGALIGHELIHGFDDSGRKFDKYGNNHNWWDEESSESFVNRTKCFRQQYGHYFYNGKYLSESNLQSENIADNGGIRIAYSAYLRWYEESLRQGLDLTMESLPNMNYTNKQLFFISYAQIWCNDIFPQLQDLKTATDEHVPGKFRVIGPLSNYEEFAKEFNCASNALMNQMRKCKIY